MNTRLEQLELKDNNYIASRTRELMITEAYEADQLEQIFFALLSGMDEKHFTDPKLPASRMRIMRTWIGKGVDPDIMADFASKRHVHYQDTDGQFVYGEDKLSAIGYVYHVASVNPDPWFFDALSVPHILMYGSLLKDGITIPAHYSMYNATWYTYLMKKARNSKVDTLLIEGFDYYPHHITALDEIAEDCDEASAEAIRRLIPKVRRTDDEDVILVIAKLIRKIIRSASTIGEDKATELLSIVEHNIENSANDKADAKVWSYISEVLNCVYDTYNPMYHSGGLTDGGNLHMFSNNLICQFACYSMDTLPYVVSEIIKKSDYQWIRPTDDIRRIVLLQKIVNDKSLSFSITDIDKIQNPGIPYERVEKYINKEIRKQRFKNFFKRKKK